MFCSVCRTSLRPGARFCQRCGARVPPPEPGRTAPGNVPPPAAPPPAYAPPLPPPVYAPPQYVYVPTPAPAAVQVPVKPRRSAGFAWTALVFLVLLYPLGLLLTVIGLCTGPRRGCFVWLFILGFIVPVIVLTTGMRTGSPQWDRRLDEMRGNFGIQRQEEPERNRWPSGGGKDRGRYGP